MRRRTLMLAGAALVASLAVARAQTARDQQIMRNAYLLAQAMNEHQAEIIANIKRSALAMSDAEKAAMTEQARAQDLSLQDLVVFRAVASFAGVPATDYDAFRAWFQMSGMGK